MTPEEVEAAVVGLLDDAQSDQARRDLLAIAAGLLRVGDPLPVDLRQWIAARLFTLHAALDSGGPTKVTQALVDLGRRRRGRQAKGSVPAASAENADAAAWCDPEVGRDMEISAAVAVLGSLIGPGHVHSIKESIAVAVGQSYDTVDRACNDNPINLGGNAPDEDGCEELRSQAEGLAAPVISAIRLSIRREPQLHHPQIRDLLRSHPRP